VIDALETLLSSSPTPDLLRLVAVPAFAWAAYRDVRTRRVPNRTWLPLAALGILLLTWEIWQLSTGGSLYGVYTVADRERFFVRVALSLGMVGSLGYLFYWFGGFGGADAKALVVLAVLFPTFPTYLLPETTLPLYETTLGVFSLTILTNAVLVGAVYPVGVAVANALRGYLAPVMLLGKPVAVDDVPETYGSLLQTPEGFSRGGLDLDALRMYLRWRGATLADLRADPERYRDPASLPAEPNPPGDGSIPTGEDAAAVEGEADTVADGGDGSADGADGDRLDPDSGDDWGAAAFLDDIEGSAYGTTAADLREGLDVLTSEDVVWVSPGLPFVVPMFLGLVVSLVYGDLFVRLVSAVV
jgi:preflagellin peptidase FlaK